MVPLAALATAPGCARAHVRAVLITWGMTSHAGFMHTRTSPGYPPAMLDRFTTIRDAKGERITTSRFPVINVNQAWDLYSTLGVMLPGIAHHYEEAPDGTRTAWILHPDGSWARATANGDQPPVIHQSGPRHLWDILDDLRHQWLRDGSLPAYGAKATITPNGTIHLTRGRWQATIPPRDGRHQAGRHLKSVRLRRRSPLA